MTLLIDAPLVAHRGRHWCHLVSDTSLAELHAFAAALDLPPHRFDIDHYDVAEEEQEHVLAAGAVLVRPRDIVAALTAAGLRRRR
jgi:Protein of unknown function (DUF4031)